MLRFTRWSWGRHGVAGTGVLAVAGSLALAGTLGAGHPLRVLDLTSGGAWVVSADQGLVTLIDGPSEQVAVSVPVPGQGHSLAVEQSGADAYLVDTDRGTVARIDTATYEVGTPVALGTPSAALDVLQNDPPPAAASRSPDGRHVVYVVDPSARTATQVDATSLLVQHEIALSAQPGPGQSAVDHAGNLWVVDAAAGTLTHIDPDRTDGDGTLLKTVRRTPAATPTARLLLVQGEPVLADPASGTVATLTAGGGAQVSGCLDTRPTDTVQLLGSRTSPEVYTAVAGALLVASTERQQCSRTIAVGDATTAQFGPLAQSGRYVFVPDFATGTTTVVDTVDGSTAKLDLTEPGNRVQLVSKDGLVFYNDLDGHEAGVLTLRGGQWEAAALDKYDPETGEGTNIVVPPDAPEAPAEGADPGGDAEQSDTSDDPTDPPVTPGDRPDGRDGTTTGPTITALGVAPDPVVLGEPATFTATVNGAAGGTWEWTLTDPGGGAVATSTQANAFAHTLPAGGIPGAYQLRLTVAADGRSTTQTLPVTVVAGVVVSITALLPDATEYVAFAAATIDADVVGGDAPDAEWEWTAEGVAHGQLPFTPPAPGEPLVIPDVGDEGTLHVSLTVRRGTIEDSATVDVPIRSLCHITMFDEMDVSSGSGFIDVSQFDCIGDQPLAIGVPSWLSGPTEGTTTASGVTRLPYTVVGVPPVDGDNVDALTITNVGAGTHVTFPIDVHANIAPAIIPSAAMPGGYTECLRDGAITSFWASYRDGEQSTLEVYLINGAAPRRMAQSTAAETLYFLQVPTAELVGLGWGVEATDEHGETSPRTHALKGSCW